jgi:hypothetical protein
LQRRSCWSGFFTPILTIQHWTPQIDERSKRDTIVESPCNPSNGSYTLCLEIRAHRSCEIESHRIRDLYVAPYANILINVGPSNCLVESS